MCFAAFFLLSGTWMIEAFGAKTISLRELEGKVHASSQVLAAAAELEQQINLYEREQAISGWKVFAGVSNGAYQESTDVDTTRQFNQAAVKVGLRYPLLGTRTREQLNILHAEARAWEHRHKVELAAQMSLHALRSHYANAWGSERRIELSRAFLEGRETMEALLAARTSQGFLLDADRQEFITSFELAMRNIASAQAIQKRALGVIDLMTHADPAGYTLDTPSLPSPCVDEARLKAGMVERNPELALLRGQVDAQFGVVHLGRRSAVDASLDIAGSASMDYPDVEPGYGVTLSFNVQFPAGVGKASEAGRRADLAGLKKAQLDLDRKTGELLADVADSLEQYRAAIANLRFANQRVRAALEAVRERQLRAGFLPGDTLEQLQQGRFQYYQTSMDLIDAEVILLQAQAGLLRMLPEGCAEAGEKAAMEDPTDSVITSDPIHLDWLSWPKRLPQLRLTAAKTDGRRQQPAGASPEAPKTLPLAVYLWDSGPWLDGTMGCEPAVKALSDYGVGRVLMSLDKDQIESAALSEGGGSLREFLDCARKNGLKIELLLGEPTWILPTFREDLLHIVQKLKDFSFDGLHLDLEPDQLDTRKYSREYLLAELIHTLHAVKAVSSWPVGLSVHPRYFDRRAFKVCFGCGLESLGISEVVLMVYVADANKVVERVVHILKTNPDLRFSVAVSVEPELSPAESFSGQGRSGLRKAVDSLQRGLVRGNFTGIVIQSWEHLEAMKP